MGRALGRPPGPAGPRPNRDAVISPGPGPGGGAAGHAGWQPAAAPDRVGTVPDCGCPDGRQLVLEEPASCPCVPVFLRLWREQPVLRRHLWGYVDRVLAGTACQPGRAGPVPAVVRAAVDRPGFGDRRDPRDTQ